MILQRMNRFIGETEPFEIPNGRGLGISRVTRKEEMVQCAYCGKSMLMYMTFESKDLLCETGEGYAICIDCLIKEIHHEVRSQRNSNGEVAKA